MRRDAVYQRHGLETAAIVRRSLGADQSGGNMDGRTGRAARPLYALVGLALLLYLLAPASGPSVSSAQATVGTPLVWGADDLGQLGDGATADRVTPGPPTGLTNVTALAGNGDLSMALKSDGTVWTWGSNSQNGTTA